MEAKAVNKPTELKIEKVNSAAFRADFTKYAERIQREGLEVIVQRNNKDLFRAVPLK
jgi:hypothetical protein